MRTVSLVINGRSVRAEVEPRTSLVDFLREHQSLTATHVGCEHGVCGACTVMIDGAVARSCITFAAAADGAEIRTLEGFETDPVMDVLREAFATHHGLQCGFCTPGMLMTGRDIITRLPDADEKRIRLELAGNLCRCTGYVGIVNAVQSAMATLKGKGSSAPIANRTIGPVGSHPPSASEAIPRRAVAAANGRQEPPTKLPAENLGTVDWASVERDGVELKESFSVPFSCAEVWKFFADIDQVARCMPGARLAGPVQDGKAEGEVNIKLGPIVSIFRGVLDVARDDGNLSGLVRATGRDTKSQSNARALIAYDVRPKGAVVSQVDVSVKFLLSGALAQFSRSGLIKDVADHLTHVFAQNLEARLAGRPVSPAGSETLDAGAVARSAIWARIRRFIRAMFGG